jgi:hypothetical protein
MKTRRPWTADDDAALEQMLRSGQHYSDISVSLGRTCASLQDRAYKLGLTGIVKSGRSWSEAEEAKARQMAASGMTYLEIAKRTGRTVKAIQDKMRRVRGTREKYAPVGAPLPSDTVSEKASKIASAALLKRLNEAFEAFAKQHGINPYAARLMLMNGVGNQGRDYIAAARNDNRKLQGVA